jgi:hypothetical protein
MRNLAVYGVDAEALEDVDDVDGQGRRLRRRRENEQTNEDLA